MVDRQPAVFLDRDGVLTEPVWNPATAEFESPHALSDLQLCADIIGPLQRLQALGFALFIVSNQPSHAKGKVALAVLEQIAAAVDAELGRAGIAIRQSYYCYHHPQGSVAEYSGPCRCRKPSPYFLFQAAAHHAIDLGRSWMIGDRDSDIQCGQAAGCRTVLIQHPQAGAHQGRSQPTAVVANLAAAVGYIDQAVMTPADQTASQPTGQAVALDDSDQGGREGARLVHALFPLVLTWAGTGERILLAAGPVADPAAALDRAIAQGRVVTAVSADRASPAETGQDHALTAEDELVSQLIELHGQVVQRDAELRRLRAALGHRSGQSGPPFTAYQRWRAVYGRLQWVPGIRWPVRLWRYWRAAWGRGAAASRR